MCQKSLKNDLGIKIDIIQLLKHIFDVFFTQKKLFPEKKSENFMFLTKCCVAPRGVCKNLKLGQKVSIIVNGDCMGVFEPQVKNLTQVSPGFEKISLFIEQNVIPLKNLESSFKKWGNNFRHGWLIILFSAIFFDFFHH